MRRRGLFGQLDRKQQVFRRWVMFVEQEPGEVVRTVPALPLELADVGLGLCKLGQQVKRIRQACFRFG